MCMALHPSSKLHPSRPPKTLPLAFPRQSSKQKLVGSAAYHKAKLAAEKLGLEREECLARGREASKLAIEALKRELGSGERA